MFRKSKSTEPAPEATSEFEQTLVAEPDGESTEPLEFAGESAVREVAEPETVAPMLEVPDDLRPYVEQEGSQLVLKQHHFGAAQKEEAEERLASPTAELVEQDWIPHRRESVRDIQTQVDALKWEPRYQPRAAAWLRRHDRERAQILMGLERIPPDILEKRIVYETEGGFVVEVTYRELGDIQEKYFTIEAAGGRRRALESVQSGRYARATILAPAVIDVLAPTRGRRSPIPPGRVLTWPIRNKVDVKEIEGIGDIYTRRLFELGLHTTDQLRLSSAEILADHLGTSPRVVEKWQQMAELLIVPGIGKQYAEILVKSGITGIEALRGMTGKALAGIVNAYVDTQETGGAHVSSPRGQAWIRAAKRLKRSPQRFPTSTDTS